MITAPWLRESGTLSIIADLPAESAMHRVADILDDVVGRVPRPG